ncbi:VanW family protein [Neobacillus sp. LXY-4]|uniref:VanW family protein n=1 Tax=Neobacillus sp. LXY-4 TaxID=3379826 RepID=UPI003EDF8FD0
MYVKRKWIISFILIGSLLGLAGCSEKTTKEKAMEKKIAELEKKIDQGKKAKKAKQTKEEPKLIMVNVVDPTSKKVIKTINPKEMGFGTDDNKYKQDIEAWVKEIARGTETTPGYDQRNVPDRIDANGQVIKGSPRVVLEEAELVNRIMEASTKGGNVELPLTVQASGYRPEDVPLLGEVVVASYTTSFNPSVTGRNRNIELSAAAINNVIVGTDDYFSFNTTVGPSDEAHGYQPAQEAVDGVLVMGIGGGICQTSSTLFNAVDQLGVSYVERHHHSVTVGYVPAGRDATVSYGGVDFRFQNTAGAPFLIKTIYGNGTLTVEIRTSAQYEGVLKKAV